MLEHGGPEAGKERAVYEARAAFMANASSRAAALSRSRSDHVACVGLALAPSTMPRPGSRGAGSGEDHAGECKATSRTSSRPAPRARARPSRRPRTIGRVEPAGQRETEQTRAPPPSRRRAGCGRRGAARCRSQRARVGPGGARPAHELRKARVARADETPDTSAAHERQRHVAGRPVPGADTRPSSPPAARPRRPAPSEDARPDPRPGRHFGAVTTSKVFGWKKVSILWFFASRP